MLGQYAIKVWLTDENGETTKYKHRITFSLYSEEAAAEELSSEESSGSEEDGSTS